VQQAQQGFGAGQAYTQQATSPEAMQDYMSPYMQNVVNQQQREAARTSQIQQQGIQAQATQQGAFGGSRSAIVDAERQRNLATQMGDIQGAGLQQAYQQAQQAQQFGANLGIQGLQAGYQGLNTGLAGTAQGMQGAQTGIAGQQAGLSGLNQSGQLSSLGMQGAGLGLQGTGQRLAAGQLGLQGTAQGMQGAGLGLQGVGQQIAGGQLGLQGTAQGISGAQAGLQGVGQELASGQLGLQGTAQGISGAQAGIQGSQAGMQGAQTGISGAQAGLQGVGQQIAGGQLGLQGANTGISGQQAGMQGAQAGMQGVGQATTAGQYGLSGAELGVRGAGVLGGLGGQQFEQEMATTDAMQKYGALQQQQQQQGLDFAYQQEMARQQYPYQQLSYMSDLLRGVPSGNQSQLQYTQGPDQTAQLLGTGLAAYGAFGRKEGGQVKSYQAGGQVSPDAMSTMAVQELPSRLRRLSDTQLAAYARSVKDAITLSAVQSEMQRRARTRMPGGEVPQDTTAEGIAKRAQAASIGQPRVQMAGGGIVALAHGGSTSFGPQVTFPRDVGTEASQRARAKMMGLPPPEMMVRTPEAHPNYEEQTQRDREALISGYDQFGNAIADVVSIPFKGLGSAGNVLNRGLRAVGVPVPNAPSKYTLDSSLTPFTDDYNRATANRAPNLETATDRASILPRGSQTNPAEKPELVVTQDEQPDPQTGQQTGQQTGPQDRIGIMSGSQMPSTFEQFKAMTPKGEIDPAQQSILSDMQTRLADKIQRAEGQENTAMYDALLTAGLAMMGGTSLADGIARAAQTGGATYLSGKKDAQKAIETAEDAEIAFRQYEMELMKGNDKAAADQFNKFIDLGIDLKKIDATYANAAATKGDAQTNKLMTQARLIESQIDRSTKEVAAQPKYKTRLDAFTKQLETYGTLDPADQARYNTLMSEIQDEAFERTGNLRSSLEDVYGQITGDTGGFKVIGQKKP